MKINCHRHSLIPFQPKEVQYTSTELCASQNHSIPPKPKERARGSEGTPKCWYCKGEEDETIDHFFLSCAKFNDIRAFLLLQMKESLEALGARGTHAWLSFEQGSLVSQSEIILGILSFGGVVDDVIDQFRQQYVAKAWNERIVI